MNYIIFDLELNSKPFKSKIPNEIIEIGAVKVNEQLEITDKFQAFIKPKHFPKLFSRIKKKTNIQQVDINSAKSFKLIMKIFKEWLGEDYLLCSWGYDDYYHLKTNCKLHNIRSNWINEFLDIQKQFSIIHKLEKGKTASLSNALILYNIEVEEGSMHRADIDAKYTCKIFINLFKKLDFSNIIKK
ncbi:MAG: exonuclease domain-containing protein [Tepidibacter sp.]|uniref:3'-5' exonuclease n=1 Tax=Tepidibacter sp. TaxID=2529387 RepID=UPI0025E97806|nr:3'-5' exonuclease [Tepidibacter sp.]MCT4508045.1 exonuclease domain-containing protein [Tepidibacter sp.]